MHERRGEASQQNTQETCCVRRTAYVVTTEQQRMCQCYRRAKTGSEVYANAHDNGHPCLARLRAHWPPSLSPIDSARITSPVAFSK